MAVELIHLGAAGEPELWTVEEVQAVAGKGLEGDRHFHDEGAPAGLIVGPSCVPSLEPILGNDVARVDHGARGMQLAAR